MTSNVRVPGGTTNTALGGDQPGDPAKMRQPEIMRPPLLWLLWDEAATVNGRRYVTADWDTALPPTMAAEKAAALIAWGGIVRLPIEPR